jgi:ribulose-phosphate 3-epimerase
MDGIFVPRYGLFPELLKTIKKLSKVPVDVHLMVQDAQPYIEIFVKSGADIITVHSESERHLSRTIRLIKEAGVKAGVAINPATPLDVLDYIIDDLDSVLILGINPGIVGHPLIEKTYDKIHDLKTKLEGKSNIIISVDGGVTFASAPKMVELGANMLVCGTSTIFNQKRSIDKMVIDLRKKINSSL